MGYCMGWDRVCLLLDAPSLSWKGVEPLINYCSSGYYKKVAPVETGAVTKTNCL